MFLSYVFYVRMKVVMFQFWFQSAKDAESICFPLLIEKGLGSSIFTELPSKRPWELCDSCHVHWSLILVWSTKKKKQKTLLVDEKKPHWIGWLLCNLKQTANGAN